MKQNLHFIDITNQCKFEENDGDLLPLIQCICGKRYKYWQAILKPYYNDLFKCECGRKLMFRNEIKIYEIKESLT